MSAECLVLENAKKLAKARHLDSKMVTCGGCQTEVDCVYSGVESDDLAIETQDVVQDMALDSLEKPIQSESPVNKFYSKLQKRAILFG